MKKDAKKKELNKEQIAELAFKMYEKEGRPQGRDFNHWIRAEQLLRENGASVLKSFPNVKQGQ